MAYVSANLNMIAGTPGGTFRLWHYAAGTDAQTAIRVAGYITDGYKKGMRSGDVVFAILTSGAGAIFVCNASAFGATVDVVDLNDGVAIAVTDTD